MNGGGDSGPATGLRVGVAVLAAGCGRRMGSVRKGYLPLRGEPVLLHALRPFLARGDVVTIVVALAPADAAAPPSWLGSLDRRVLVVPGGESRTASVRAALEALPGRLDVVVVHDGARPLLAPDVLDRCIRAAAEGKGAVAGYRAVDTLKEVDAEGRVLATPDRDRLWHAQTPQAFPAALIRRAHQRADGGDGATDDASLVERVGGTVVMVESSPRNLKITHPEDLRLAELFIELKAAGR